MIASFILWLGLALREIVRASDRGEKEERERKVRCFYRPDTCQSVVTRCGGTSSSKRSELLGITGTL